MEKKVRKGGTVLTYVVDLSSLTNDRSKGYFESNHKLKLKRRGDDLKWEYCQLCNSTRKLAGKVFNSMTVGDWIKKGIDNCSKIPMGSYNKEEAIKLLQYSLIKQYNKEKNKR